MIAKCLTITGLVLDIIGVVVVWRFRITPANLQDGHRYRGRGQYAGGTELAKRPRKWIR